MPSTLTLKNIPDAVYQRLKASAEFHRRSMNSQAIVCLESALLSTRLSPAEQLERARVIRAELSPAHFSATDIDTAKRKGRE